MPCIFSAKETKSILQFQRYNNCILIMYCLCYIGIAFEAFAPIGSPGRFGIQDTDPVVLEDPVVQEIATKHNATPAQVLLNQ